MYKYRFIRFTFLFFFWQAGRFPHLTYANLKSIIGKRFDDPLVEEYRRRHVNKMVVDKARNMPVFIHNETIQLSIEELIAYQFQNAKQQASATAGESVKDVVITVNSITIHLCFVFFFFFFFAYIHFLPIDYTLCKSI